MTEWNPQAILEGKDPEELLTTTKEQIVQFMSEWNETKEPTPKQYALFLERYEQLMQDLGKIGVCYELQFSTNTKDETILAKISSLKQVGAEIDELLLPFSLWFQQLSNEQAQVYLDATELSTYHHFLTHAREYTPHTRSKEVEQILSLHSVTGAGAFSDLYTVITSAYTYDFGDKKGLTEEELRSFVQDPDPKVREEAYTILLDKYVKESTVLYELLKNVVLEWKNSCKIRSYSSPLSKRNLSNEVSDDAVQALLNVVQKKVSTFQQYFKIKHELNDKAYEFSRVHLYAPYKNRLDKKYDYESSKSLVLETYKQFSERLHDEAVAIFNAKRVHAFPTKDKRGGAYCMGTNPTTEPYIMLNHTDKLKDVFTMIHEFGHGIHDQLARKQTYLNYHPTLPLAETASIFGEMLLAQRILGESDDVEEKKSILMYLLDNQYASIGRQSYFVLFEQKAHEMIAQGATKGELEQVWMGLLKEQFGKMHIPENFKNEWNYIPHIHHTPFYCYAYSWGNLLVLSLYAMYKEEGKSFVPKFLSLLESGGSAYPLDLLKEIGIDATQESFWEKGFSIIEEEVALLKQLCE